jgi:hypothetical protein
MQYLYLLESDGYFKIGIANDVQNRIAQLSTGNPHQINLVFCYGFRNSEFVERALHQKFLDTRLRGEWYILTPADMAEMDDVCRLLGGIKSEIENTNEREVSDAEDVQELIESQEWDYAAMFSDGWRIEQFKKGYWQWRRGGGLRREAIYGGRLLELPCSVDEVRRIYDKK